MGARGPRPVRAIALSDFQAFRQLVPTMTSRRAWLVLGVLLIPAVLVLVFGFWIFGDAFSSEPSLTTNTRSDSIATPAARVAFIGRYVKLRTPVRDAVFQVVYHDNGGGLVPGPSDADIVAALQVEPGDRAKWLDGATPASPSDASQPLSGYRRISLPAAWGARGPGELYERQGAWLVWHPEGVLEISIAMH
jgi:hypothetical protein